MKQLRAVLVIVVALVSATIAHTESCQVSLRVEGFRNHAGHLGITIFRSSDGWPEDNNKAFFHDAFPITGDQTTTRLTLPEGRYAIAVPPSKRPLFPSPAPAQRSPSTSSTSNHFDPWSILNILHYKLFAIISLAVL